MLRIPLRVLFYREDDQWIAHCLEFDLIGHGDAREDALQMLKCATEIQIEQSFRNEVNLDNLFTPADGKYLGMFAAGKDVAAGEFTIQAAGSRGAVLIERAEVREFSDDLVPA